MKKVRGLPLLLICLSLCSCDYLFDGLFPADIGQMTARRDLSADLTADQASQFSLSIVTLNGKDYVLLFSSRGFDSSKNHLYVLSPDLDVIDAYSLDDIGALDPNDKSFKGSAALAYLNDQTIVIGNVVAVPDGSSGLSLSCKLEPSLNPVSVELQNWAIEGPSSADYVWSGFSTSSSSGILSYTAYDSGWTGYSAMSGNLGGSFSGIEGVFADPTDADDNDAFVVMRSNDSSTYSFYTISKSPDLSGGFASTPLASHSYFTKKYLTENSIAMTKDGFVAYNESSRSWTRFTVSNPDTEYTMRAQPLDWQYDAAAFSYSGGYYCVWNHTTRTLSRYEDWW